jgi:RimJ/RimL family protein N-acetyltransferase
MTGRYVTLEPLQPEHAAHLWPLMEDHLWDYMFDGPFATEQEFTESIVRKSESQDPRFLAVLVNSQAVGIASFMRDEPRQRVIEVGSIVFTRALQRTTAATEAMFLMAKYAFEQMRYRRYEWKCNALNLPSRRAAERLGFTFEGVFRQHMIVKDQNRDTAWFSMLDKEWPARKIEFERWLHPSNFTEDGTQLTHLSQ